MRPFVVFALAVVTTSVAGAQQRRVITFEDFAGMRARERPADLARREVGALRGSRRPTSPATRDRPQTFVVPVSAGEPHPFPCCDGPDVAATEARWSPDGKHIAYIADDQLWIADANGWAGTRSPASTAARPVRSGRRRAIASRSLRPSIPTAPPTRATSVKRKAAADSKVKAHVADQLMFRHWNAWDDGTRSHLFVVTARRQAACAT